MSDPSAAGVTRAQPPTGNDALATFESIGATPPATKLRACSDHRNRTTTRSWSSALRKSAGYPVSKLVTLVEATRGSRHAGSGWALDLATTEGQNQPAQSVEPLETHPAKLGTGRLGSALSKGPARGPRRPPEGCPAACGALQGEKRSDPKLAPQ